MSSLPQCLGGWQRTVLTAVCLPVCQFCQQHNSELRVDYNGIWEIGPQLTI